MSIIGSNVLAGASGSGVSAYEIEQSLRFEGSSSFSRTYSSAGNRKTFTISVWVKRAQGGSSYTNEYMFGAYDGGGSQFGLQFYGNGSQTELQYDQGYTGPGSGYAYTNANYRDNSAWYHIIYVADYSNSTAADRWRFYVNGERITSFRTSSPVINGDASWNYQGAHYIGRLATSTSNNFKGYMAELHILDGTAVTNADDFGETNEQGVWVPKEVSGVTYGTNGVYLKFDPSATNGIGHDHSGNGNNWTASGFTTSGTGTDVMSDTPTKNWCTLNPLTTGSYITLSNGNLDAVGNTSSDNGNTRTTFVVTSGKFYFETTLTANTVGTYPQVGIMREVDGNRPNNAAPQAGYSSGLIYGSHSIIYQSDGTTYSNSSSSSYGNSFTNGDVIGVAYDGDNGAIYFSKNGTWQNSGDPTSGATKTGAALTWTDDRDYVFSIANYNSTATSCNFGQRDFAYTPPTGFKALNTSNLPAPDIADGSEHMNTVAWTGTGASRTIDFGMQPDWIWAKGRNTAANHRMSDNVRGGDGTTFYNLCTNNTNAENTDTVINGITSTGVTFKNVDDHPNVSGSTYVGWGWKANGSGSSNTDGSITSTVSANPSAGFSIVTFTKTGGTTTSNTVGHGLGVAPAMLILKGRVSGNVDNWYVYHQSLGPTYRTFLNTTAASFSPTETWNNTAPTSSVFTVKNFFDGDSVAYCFAEVEGYSKFGSYTGNGNADGPFVYLGFKPAFLIIKSSTSGENWHIKDSTRETYNPIADTLFANGSGSEANLTNSVDFLSNGFKLRSSSWSGENSSGNTFIFAAFAEHPFGGSGVSPATAR